MLIRKSRLADTFFKPRKQGGGVKTAVVFKQSINVLISIYSTLDFIHLGISIGDNISRFGWMNSAFSMI